MVEKTNKTLSIKCDSLKLFTYASMQLCLSSNTMVSEIIKNFCNGLLTKIFDQTNIPIVVSAIIFEEKSVATFCCDVVSDEPF